jgi:hypothetical protein
VGFAFVASSAAWGLETMTSNESFGELRIGGRTGASLADFCGVAGGLALPATKRPSPMTSAEVVVSRMPHGVSASVILREDETTTRKAVFATDRLIARLMDRCEDSLDVIPVVAIGAEGLVITHDKDGNPDFHLQGLNQ